MSSINYRLIRWGALDAERPGILDQQGQRRDLSTLLPECFDWRGWWWQHGISAETEKSCWRQLAELIDQHGGAKALPLVAEHERWAAAIPRPGCIYAIGLNYVAHAAESDSAVPAEPLVFNKAPASCCGPYDSLVIPHGRSKVDWEVELGVVIGKSARFLSAEDNPLDYVAGYCLVNDVSERDDQKNRGGQWIKGKSHDGFCPIGPWVLPADEVTDAQQLRLWSAVDGQRMQDGTTADMVFSVAHIIRYLSEFVTLEPGDLICTGTPPGVAMGYRGPGAPPFLKPGQTLSCGIDLLGKQERRCV